MVWTASGTGKYATIIEFTTLQGQVIQGLPVGSFWRASPPRPNMWGVAVRYDPNNPHRFIAFGGGATSRMKRGYLLWPVISVSMLIMAYVLFIATVGAFLITGALTG